MALLVGGRRGVRLDRVVAGIEVLDDALDRPALAAGVATFEDDEQAGPDLAGPELAAEVEAQLEQPALGDLDTSFVLAAPQPLREVELVESVRRAHRLRCYVDGGAATSGTRRRWTVGAARPRPGHRRSSRVRAHRGVDEAPGGRRASSPPPTAPPPSTTSSALIDAVDVVVDLGAPDGAGGRRRRSCAAPAVT